MHLSRRDYLQLVAGAVAGGAAVRSAGALETLGIPGPYRGKVVGVTDGRCLSGGSYQAKPIHEMLNRGMCELTGAANPADAWRQFFNASDAVGIKINPVGQPYICGSSELLNAILQELQNVGIKPGNITVFERYHQNILNSPYSGWIPKDVRMGYAAEAIDPVQQNIDGYDPDCYVELPFTLSGFALDNKIACRSYAARFISQDVNKLINLPVLKSHNAAGVTLALKNLSHGLVNNVSRTHDGPDLRYTDFIPAVVNMPVIRQKTVLNILDGTKGLCHGGPGMTTAMARYIWDHNTMYFATDPVALDVIGRGVIEAQRKELGLWPPAAAHRERRKGRPGGMGPGQDRVQTRKDRIGRALADRSLTVAALYVTQSRKPRPYRAFQRRPADFRFFSRASYLA
jgi:Domain of unknown function (DUF362)